MSETFGTTLRRLRLEQDLTQKDLARMINYNHATVSKVENGKNRPGSCSPRSATPS